MKTSMNEVDDMYNAGESQLTLIRTRHAAPPSSLSGIVVTKQANGRMLMYTNVS